MAMTGSMNVFISWGDMGGIFYFACYDNLHIVGDW